MEDKMSGGKAETADMEEIWEEAENANVKTAIEMREVNDTATPFTPSLQNSGSTFRMEDSETKSRLHFDGWELWCGHPTKYVAVEDERKFHFEDITITLKQTTETNFFEVEILDFWTVDKKERDDWKKQAMHTQFFGFVSEKYMQNPDVTKIPMAESPHGWCVGIHSQNLRKIATYHQYDERKQKQSPPSWGKTDASGQLAKRWDVGDVIGCYYDSKAQEIWFGLNGEWRYFKGLAFSCVKETLFPAICFNNGSVRVNTDEDHFIFGPPTDADRKDYLDRIITITIPAQPKEEEKEEEVKAKKYESDDVFAEEGGADIDSIAIRFDRIFRKDAELGRMNGGVAEDKKIDEEDEKKEEGKKKEIERKNSRLDKEKRIGSDWHNDYWGIGTNISHFGSYKNPFGSELTITMVDQDKEAFKQGIRNGMKILKVNNLPFNDDNAAAIVEILDKSPALKTTFELFRPFIPGHYHFYQANGSVCTEYVVTNRINPQSCVLGYLSSGDKIEIVHTEEFVDYSDAMKRRKYLRGLIGKRTDEKVLTIIAEKDKWSKGRSIAEEPRTEDKWSTGNQLHYFESATYVETRMVNNTPWYRITSPYEGWVCGGEYNAPDHDFGEKHQSVVVDCEPFGWITLQDYSTNKIFVRSELEDKIVPERYYRVIGTRQLSEKMIGMVFLDPYDRQPIRALRPEETVNVINFKVIYETSYFDMKERFKPGIWNVQKEIEVFLDENKTKSDRTIEAGQQICISRVITTSPEMILGELKDGTGFVKMHEYKESWNMYMQCRYRYDSSKQIREILGQLDTGYWILIKSFTPKDYNRTTDREDRFFLLPEEEAKRKDQERKNDEGEFKLTVPTKEKQPKYDVTFEYDDLILSLTSNLSKDSELYKKGVRYGQRVVQINGENVSEIPKDKLDELNRKLNERTEEMTLTLRSNWEKIKLLTQWQDSKGKDTVDALVNRSYKSDYRAYFPESGYKLYKGSFTIAYFDDNNLHKVIEETFMAQDRKTYKMTYVGHDGAALASGAKPFFKDIPEDCSETSQRSLESSWNIAGFVVPNDVVYITEFREVKFKNQNEAHTLYGKMSDGFWLKIQKKNKMFVSMEPDARERTVSFEEPFKLSELKEEEKFDLAGEYTSYPFGDITFKSTGKDAFEGATSDGKLKFQISKVEDEVKFIGTFPYKKWKCRVRFLFHRDKDGKKIDWQHCKGMWAPEWEPCKHIPDTKWCWTTFWMKRKYVPSSTNSWGFEWDEKTQIITKVFPGSPADKQGMTIGWRIKEEFDPSKYGASVAKESGNVHQLNLTFDERIGKCIINQDAALVRKGPSDDAPVAGFIRRKTYVMARNCKNGWYEVQETSMKNVVRGNQDVNIGSSYLNNGYENGRGPWLVTIDEDKLEAITYFDTRNEARDYVQNSKEPCAWIMKIKYYSWGDEENKVYKVVKLDKVPKARDGHTRVVWVKHLDLPSQSLARGPNEKYWIREEDLTPIIFGEDKSYQKICFSKEELQREVNDSEIQYARGVSQNVCDDSGLSPRNSVDICTYKDESYPIVICIRDYGHMFTRFRTLFELSQAKKIFGTGTHFIKSESSHAGELLAYENATYEMGGDYNKAKDKNVKFGETYEIKSCMLWYGHSKCGSHMYHYHFQIKNYGWISLKEKNPFFGSCFTYVPDLDNRARMLVGEYEWGREISDDLTVKKEGKLVGQIKLLNRHTLEMFIDEKQERCFGDFTPRGIYWFSGKAWRKITADLGNEPKQEGISSWLNQAWNVSMKSAASVGHIQAAKSSVAVATKNEPYYKGLSYSCTFDVIKPTTMEKKYSLFTLNAAKHHYLGAALLNNYDLTIVMGSLDKIYLVKYGNLLRHDSVRALDDFQKQPTMTTLIDEHPGNQLYSPLGTDAKISANGDYMAYFAARPRGGLKRVPVILDLNVVRDSKFVEFDLPDPPDFANYTAMTFSPTNKYFVIAGSSQNEKGEKEDSICLYDMKHPKQKFYKIGQFSVVDLQRIEFSPDGTFFSCITQGFFERNCPIQKARQSKVIAMNTLMWTFDDGKEQPAEDLISAEIDPPAGNRLIHDVSFSHNGEFLGIAYCEDHQMEYNIARWPNHSFSGGYLIYTTRTWSPLKRIVVTSPRFLQFTTNHKLLLTTSELQRPNTYATSVLDVPENKRLIMFKAQKPNNGSAFFTLNTTDGEKGFFAYDQPGKLRIVNCDDPADVNEIFEEKKFGEGKCIQVCLSRDNSSLKFIAKCFANIVKVFDANGAESLTIEHGANDCSFTYHNGRYYFAEGGSNKFVNVYVLKKGGWEQAYTETSKLTMDGEVVSVNFTDNGLFFAGKCIEAKVCFDFWLKPSEQRIRKIDLKGFVNDVAYSPVFSLIAVAMNHKVLFLDTRVWRILMVDDALTEDSQPVTIRYEKDTILHVEFSPDGACLLVSINTKSQARGRDVRPTKCVFYDIVTFTSFMELPVSCRVKLSYDNKFIVTHKVSSKYCLECFTYPPPNVDSLMNSDKVYSSPPILTMLLSQRRHLGFKTLPEKCSNLWSFAPFHAWIFSDLFAAHIDENVPDSYNVPKKVMNEIEEVLMSLTKKKHWVDFVNIDPLSFQNVLLKIAQLRDPKIANLFEDFIESIELLPIYNLEESKDKRILWKDMQIDALELHETVLPIKKDRTHIWKDYEAIEGAGGGDLGSFVVPVQGLADLAFLEAIKEFTTLWKSNLFKTDVMHYVVDLWWDQVKFDFFQELLQFFCLLITYTATAKKVQDIHWDFSEEVIFTICAILSCINSLTFLWYETQQIRNLGWRYFLVGWNVFQSTLHFSILSSYAWGALASGAAEEYQRPVVLSSVCALLLYILTFYYLRGYSKTSWLITVLLEIVSEARYFLLLMVIIVMGFSIAFFGLGVSDSMWDSMVTTWTMGIVGELEPDLNDLLSPLVAKLLYIFMVFLLAIVCLNAIIAFMGDTYDKVQESMNMEIRFAQIKLFLEFAEQWPHKRRKRASEKLQRWIHVLRPERGARMEWEGQTAYLRRFVTELIEPIQKDITSEKKRAENDTKAILDLVEMLKKDTKKQMIDLKDEHTRQTKLLETQFELKMEAQKAELKKQMESVMQKEMDSLKVFLKDVLAVKKEDDAISSLI